MDELKIGFTKKVGKLFSEYPLLILTVEVLPDTD